MSNALNLQFDTSSRIHSKINKSVIEMGFKDKEGKNWKGLVFKFEFILN